MTTQKEKTDQASKTDDLEDACKWESAWKDERTIQQGDILRVPDGKRYLYAIATGGGNGCRANSLGSAIFVDHEEPSLKDTLQKVNKTEARWEASWGGIQHLTNKDEVLALVSEAEPLELLTYEPALDHVEGCGHYAAILANRQRKKGKVVLAYNTDVQYPFAITMHKGIYEAHLRNSDGKYERTDDLVCTRCMRPTSQADARTFSVLSNNTTTCADCDDEKEASA